MQVVDGRFVFSPGDLAAQLACPHLTTFAVQVARDELEKPFPPNVYAEPIRRKGTDHEQA